MSNNTKGLNSLRAGGPDFGPGVSSTYILHFCHNQRSHIQSSQAAASLVLGGRQHGQCLFQ